MKADSNGQSSTSATKCDTMPCKKTIFKVIKDIITTKSTSAVTIYKSLETTPQYVERSKNTEYLMMCLLAAFLDNEVLKFLPSDQVSSIVMQFNNCAPKGAFGNTYPT